MAVLRQWVKETAAEAIKQALLTSVADGAYSKNQLADYYANGTNQYTHASFQLYLTGFDSVPDDGGMFELHCFYDIGGKVCDGRAGTWASEPLWGKTSRLGVFPIAPANQAQCIQLNNIKIYPFDMYFTLNNHCGTQLLTTSANALIMQPFNAEYQT